MFAKSTKIEVAILTAALLGGLVVATGDVWARGGRGGGGGGGYRGGYSGGGNRSYNSGATHSYNSGATHSNNGGATHNYNGNYSSGYRGTNTAGAGRANSGFASRHFANNSNLSANANAGNRAAAMSARPYGAGYAGLGYGGMGGLGYGMGYPFFGMYGMMGMGMGMGMGGMGMGGMGGGYGGGGYGGGGYGGGGYGGGGYGVAGYGNGVAGNVATDGTNAAAPTASMQDAQPAAQVASADVFDTKGEADFKAGNYAAAVQDWQHALVDTPHNGGEMLLLAQSLFATGQYQAAAGAVQLGMQMLPQDQWGNVLKHYADLYPNNQAFTDQLRALEKARTANPNDPALRFLLGYEYGYLGYPKQAVTEFDAAVAQRPQDRGAVVMRNEFATAAGVAALPLPALPTPPATPGGPANPAPETKTNS